MVEENALFDELLDDADAAAEAMQVGTNAGKFSIKMQPRVWTNNVLDDASQAEYKAAAAGAKQIDLLMGVDIQEFKPDLTFQYERKVTYRKGEWFNSKKLNTIGLRTTVALLLNLGGCADLEDAEQVKALKDLPNKDIVKALLGLNGKYIFASDVPNGKVWDDKPLKTIRIDRVFANRDEFLVAYTERFGAVNAVAAQDNSVPVGWDDMESFGTDVKELRGDGMADSDIATELGVSMNWVNQVS